MWHCACCLRLWAEESLGFTVWSRWVAVVWHMAFTVFRLVGVLVCCCLGRLGFCSTACGFRVFAFLGLPVLLVWHMTLRVSRLLKSLCILVFGVFGLIIVRVAYIVYSFGLEESLGFCCLESLDCRGMAKSKCSMKYHVGQTGRIRSWSSLKILGQHEAVAVEGTGKSRSKLWKNISSFMASQCQNNAIRLRVGGSPLTIR